MHNPSDGEVMDSWKKSAELSELAINPGVTPQIFLALCVKAAQDFPTLEIQHLIGVVEHRAMLEYEAPERPDQSVQYGREPDDAA